MKITNPLSILVLRFSSIGDIILTTPILRVLRHKFPNVTIHFATKNAYQDLLKGNPYIDKIHVLGQDWDAFAAEISKTKFDWFIDLHKNLRSKRLRLSSRYTNYFSYNKRNIAKWNLVNLKINNLKDYHVVQSYFAQLPIEYDGQGLDYYYPQESDFSIMKNALEDPFVALILGAKYKTKQAPRDKLLQLVKGISKPIALIGGKAEFELANWLIENARKPMLNFCGILNFDQSAFAIEQAEKIIAHDTGFMHIAAAFDKDMAVLWGNTVMEFGFSPLYKEQSRAEVIHFQTEISCRPCSKLGFDKCPRGHFKCMVDLPYQKVVAWANLLN